LNDFPKSIEDFNVELAKQAKRVVKRYDSSFDEEAVIYVMFVAADEWKKNYKKELLINIFKSL